MALLVTPPEQDPSLSPLGKVAMRPAVAADSAFLLELYASAWQDELDTIGWSISSQRTFVIMQAQTREWELIRRYPQLNRLTICVDDTPAGRMLVSCTDTVVHLIDLCLLPLWRGRGIGTRLVKDLLDESAVGQTAIQVRVPKGSRVATSCTALGFSDPKVCGHDWVLTWSPPVVVRSEHFHGGRRVAAATGH